MPTAGVAVARARHASEVPAVEVAGTHDGAMRDVVGGAAFAAALASLGSP